MKALLARLLLALSLTVNSVAVLANGITGMEVFAKPTSQEMSCNTARQQQSPSLKVQIEAENCDQSCCQHSTCPAQHVCIVHHNTFYIAQSALNLRRPVDYHEPDTMKTAVPEFKLPPENPPPIHS